MPHKHLEHYLAEVEQALEALPGAYVEHYEEEIITPERANLRIRFAAGHLLAGLSLPLPGRTKSLVIPLRQYAAFPRFT